MLYSTTPPSKKKLSVVMGSTKFSNPYEWSNCMRAFAGSVPAGGGGRHPHPSGRRSVVAPEAVDAAGGIASKEAGRSVEAPAVHRAVWGTRGEDRAAIEALGVKHAGDLAGRAECRDRGLGGRAGPRIAHFHGVQRLAHLRAVACRDAGGADEVLTGLFQER